MSMQITIRGQNKALAKRINEHIHNITIGFKNHHLSKHFRDYHKKRPIGLSFSLLEKYHKQWRGSDKIKTLRQRESWWIFENKSLTPKGLNVDFNFNGFISDK